MASEGTNPLRLVIRLALLVVIGALVYFLYETITTPWEDYEAEQFQTELTRARMDHVRNALIEYRDTRERYPSTLDSLALFVRSDSAYIGRDLNEVFVVPGGGTFDPDSLPYSPRTGNRFEYELFSNDSTGVTIYYLKDPDTEDHIGAREPNPALRNAASWE